MSNKLATSVRLTPEAIRLLQVLADYLGINQTAVIELAIRDLAKRKGVK